AGRSSHVDYDGNTILPRYDGVMRDLCLICETASPYHTNERGRYAIGLYKIIQDQPLIEVKTPIETPCSLRRRFSLWHFIESKECGKACCRQWRDGEWKIFANIGARPQVEGLRW